jgi:cytochrome c peroxidase
MNIPRLVLALTLSAVAVAATAACGGPPDGFSEEEWKTVQELGPLPEAPVDPTNKYEADERAAALGQKLFHDRRFAGPIKVDATAEEGALGAKGEVGKVACSDCHAGPAMTDLRSKGNVSNAAGYPGRNSPPLANVAYYAWFTWGGKRDTLWGQGAAAFEAGTDVNSDRCKVAHLLFAHYRAEYDAIFDHKLPVELEPGHAEGARFPDLCKPAAPGAAPGPWEAMTAEDRTAILRVMSNVGKAFAAYERKLVSGNSGLDKYIGGDRDALDASAKRGLKLFIGKAFCVQCHSGSTLQDGRFHNLGVPQEGARVPEEDLGRFGDIALLAYPFRADGAFSDNPEEGKKKLEGLAATEEDKGAFRTKGLRNVARSAPYYHTGGMATLREVVDFYDRGGGTDKFVGTRSTKLKPLNLTDQEKADLVALLESLTGEEIPESLRR